MGVGSRPAPSPGTILRSLDEAKRNPGHNTVPAPQESRIPLRFIRSMLADIRQAEPSCRLTFDESAAAVYLRRKTELATKTGVSCAI